MLIVIMLFLMVAYFQGRQFACSLTRGGKNPSDLFKPSLDD